MEKMKTEVRIVAGSLRGRKISCRVSEDLRPTPQMVREAFFSILGNAIPDRLFVDIFAGTGVVGMEALSRGAKAAYFVERDFTLADAVLAHLKKFDLVKRSKLFRTDSYRWVSSFKAPAEPINVFFSPPFVDLTSRPDILLDAAAHLQKIVAPESVLVLQSERGSPLDERAEMSTWERRVYGRNVLFLWQKEEPAKEPVDAP
jgi:16S rRNA (guanine966-N2)-methyltransferase